MPPQSSKSNNPVAGNFVDEAVSRLHATAHKNLLEAEDYVRKAPVQAVAYSILVGYLIRFFPIVALLRALAAIALASVRPLILVCGFVKIYDLFKPRPE